MRRSPNSKRASLAVALPLIVMSVPVHAQSAGEATRIGPPGGGGAAAAGAPAIPGAPPPVAEGARGSVQFGLGHSSLTGDNPDWRDYFLRGNVALDDRQGLINWELSRQRHFGETGTAASIAYTRDLSEDWYATAGAGIGTGADFLPSRRIDLAVYRKWLADRQLVTGVQWTGSKSGNRFYRDRAWQFTANYYFPFPLVAEAGVKFNTSDPGDVSIRRYFGSATYGRAKDYYVSARYDTGREGYLPTSAGVVDAVNFRSHVATVSLRKWLTRDAGFEVTGERYRNPFYRRNSVSASVFVDF